MNRNWNKDWRKSIIVMSGGFDPIHKGHLRMFREASWLGHHVVVGLNSDEWLTRKKGKPFMNFEERKEIIEAYLHPQMQRCIRLEVSLPFYLFNRYYITLPFQVSQNWICLLSFHSS